MELTSAVTHALAAPMPLQSSAAPACGLQLDDVALQQPCRVVAVRSPDGAPDWARWLAEIGFLPGERVKVKARGLGRGAPLVVQVGQSTFALRRAEAACVQVEAV
jgi:ferrous iron transport protein A